MNVSFLLLAGALVVRAQTPNVVRYHATINDVKYLYGPAASVAYVKPVEIIETNTLDAFGTH
jgi:hypothetical protein